jgi:hypothetical protein
MKYINNKILFPVICFCCINLFVKAQSVSSIKVKDIALVSYLQQLDTSSINYKLRFKIDPSSLASTVYLLFGMQKDSGNVINTQATFTHVSGIDYLSYSNQTNPVKNYTAFFDIQISKIQLRQIKWLTLYVLDNNGNYSSHFYEKLQP